MAPGWRGLRATVIRLRWAAEVMAVVLVLCVSGTARAQIGSDRYSSLIMDVATARVLWAVNPDELRHPASLTKMMTLYMAFEALRDRRIGLDQPVPVSDRAAAMPPSKLDLMPGGQITVEEAILGLVTKSANDAAGRARRVARRRRGPVRPDDDAAGPRARHEHTVFRNASGLPDPDQWTTARDLAVLARHLIQDFPARLPLLQHRRASASTAAPSSAMTIMLEDLPGRRRPQDRLHRGVRLQSRHLRRARQRAADRRGHGRRPRRASAICTWPPCSTRGSAAWTCRSRHAAPASPATRPPALQSSRRRRRGPAPSEAPAAAEPAAGACRSAPSAPERPRAPPPVEARRIVDAGEIRIERRSRCAARPIGARNSAV